jgi:hypothetical protein
MEKIENEKLLEEIWNDADFKTSKKPLLSGETLKKNRIRKLNEHGKIVAYCKVCSCEMYISTNYNGEFPLCRIHRDPNDRPDKNHRKAQNKSTE